MNFTKLSSDPLVLSHFSKSYGNKKVIDDISFSIKQGEVFGYIGRNGIGKSTTIDCIVGKKEVTSGEISIYGYNISKKSVQAKSFIGYVPSEPVCYEFLTGREYLEFIAGVFNVSKDDFNQRFTYYVNKFDLSMIDVNRKINQYSHGMKQKICLIASLIHDPDLWILDEPSVGLDIVVYEALLEIIQEMKAKGKAIFVTSHNINLITDVCDRVALVNNCKVVKIIDFIQNPQEKDNLAEEFLKVYQGQEEYVFEPLED